jgi:D-inositol-3-phosphate glycosyltransferase
MGRNVPKKKRLLWIGDAVAPTGFATVTHGILDHLHEIWDVHVLGINYLGDPHDYPYRIYPASLGGDTGGVGRLPGLLASLQPDLVCILLDPWLVPRYLDPIKQANIPVVAYMPVDALHMRESFSTYLSNLDVAVLYTEFGRQQLTMAGMETETEIIPHGVDQKLFKPLPQKKARQELHLPLDAYIVGVVGRNQPRKRLDLTMEYFAEWAKDKPDTVRLYLHCAMKDIGWDLLDLADYYGIDDRLIITSLEMTAMNGVPRYIMPLVYNSFDVQLSTTAGEGWGLGNMEGMACGIPQIVPEWSALAEWPRPAVYYVPCTTTQAHTGGINTIGGLPDKWATIEALEYTYQHETVRRELRTKSIELVRQPRFEWATIARQFHTVFTKLVP